MRKYTRMDIKATRKPAQKRILSVKVRRIIDDSPDASWMGQYGDTAKTEFAIDRAHAEDCASLEANHIETVNTLERMVSHLNTWRLACADDPNNTEWEALDEALDLCVRLQDEATECDCAGGSMGRHEHRYFNPGTVEPFKLDASWIPSEITDPKLREKYWRDAMRHNARQDYERMEALQRGDFCFIGIRAEAEIIPHVVSEGGKRWHGTVQQITSSGLWGIESDSDSAYLEEVQGEQLAELKTELLALGFSRRAIASAFKNVEEVQE